MKKLKRAFFFWLEQLQISRKERIAISSLFILVLIMGGMNLFLQQKLNYDQEHYDEIMKEFEAKSAAIEQRQLEQEQKYLPQPEDTVKGESGAGELININTAGVGELQRLEGIGQIYARRIIDYREEHGPFKSVDELLNVKGIGKIRLEKLAPFVKL